MKGANSMAERKVKQWITINGVHVPIFEGESKADVAKRFKEKIGKRNESQPMTQDAKSQVRKEYTYARNAAHNAKPEKQEKANERFEKAKNKYSKSKEAGVIKSAKRTDDRSARSSVYKEQLKDVQEDIKQFESTPERLRSVDYDKKLADLKQKEANLKGYMNRDKKSGDRLSSIDTKEKALQTIQNLRPQEGASAKQWEDYTNIQGELARKFNLSKEEQKTGKEAVAKTSTDNVTSARNYSDLTDKLNKNGLKMDSADAHTIQNSNSLNGKKVTMYDRDGNEYQGTYNKYSDGGSEIVDIKRASDWSKKVVNDNEDLKEKQIAENKKQAYSADDRKADVEYLTALYEAQSYRQERGQDTSKVDAKIAEVKDRLLKDKRTGQEGGLSDKEMREKGYVIDTPITDEMVARGEKKRVAREIADENNAREAKIQEIRQRTGLSLEDSERQLDRQGDKIKVGDDLTNDSMTKLPVGSVVTVEMPTRLGKTEKFDLTLTEFTPAGEQTKQRWQGNGYHFDNDVHNVTRNLWENSPKGYPSSLKVKQVGEIHENKADFNNSRELWKADREYQRHEASGVHDRQALKKGSEYTFEFNGRDGKKTVEGTYEGTELKGGESVSYFKGKDGKRYVLFDEDIKGNVKPISGGASYEKKLDNIGKKIRASHNREEIQRLERKRDQLVQDHGSTERANREKEAATKFNQIKAKNGSYQINRVSDGHDLSITVEKVSKRDYWGKKVEGSSPSYTVRIHDNNVKDEYGNAERLYYTYGKTFKEVKEIIKRHIKG